MASLSDAKKGIFKPAVEKQIRFLIAGAGAVVEKLEPTWQKFHDLGVRLHAVDIVDRPSGRKALPKGTSFYNWKNRGEVEKMVNEGLEHPFDFAYLSNFPRVHLATALRLDLITRNFIIPKPVDSNFGFLQTMHEEHERGGAFRDLVSRSCVHDHYRNKPLTSFLRGHIEDLHRRNGYLKTIRIYITEHQTIQTEYSRRESLECGMILDLAPHALSVICEIVPKTLRWVDKQGNTFRRIDRHFTVVSSIRGRDNHSILHSRDAETFGALHLRVSEDIEFVPKANRQWVEKLNHEFDALIVVGKGVSIQDESAERDLKAIELEFDGQSVLGNFDTNSISGVIDKSLQTTLEAKIDPKHRGLNLPLQELAGSGFAFTNAKDKQLIQPFQTFEEAFLIADLLEKFRNHHTARELLMYSELDQVANVLNRCLPKGLDQMWAMEEDPTHLLFGEVPIDSIS